MLVWIGGAMSVTLLRWSSAWIAWVEGAYVVVGGGGWVGCWLVGDIVSKIEEVRL